MKNISFISLYKVIVSVLALSIITILNTNAQSSKISGKVIDPMGEPATLVTVELLNKSNRIITATVTDIEGNFLITLSHMKYEKLRFTHLGFDAIITSAHLPNQTVQMISSLNNDSDLVANGGSKLGLK